MFPIGNIVFEKSKFNENVSAWELLAARIGSTQESSRPGTLMPKKRLLRRNARAREPTVGLNPAQRPYLESKFVAHFVD
jgi:hypothetical protein